MLLIVIHAQSHQNLGLFCFHWIMNIYQGPMMCPWLKGAEGATRVVLVDRRILVFSQRLVSNPIASALKVCIWNRTIKLLGALTLYFLKQSAGLICLTHHQVWLVRTMHDLPSHGASERTWWVSLCECW